MESVESVESVQLIAFLVQSVPNPFRLHKRTEIFDPFLLSRCSTNWSSRDPAILSESLNCQVKNNYADFQQLSTMCQYSSYRDELWTSIYNKDKLSLLNDYYISQKRKDEQCRKFLERLNGYLDTLSRDQDVFNQRNWNVDTYAIVVLYKNQYFGHIYTWVSPIESNLCFVMGIRGRVDGVFIKDNLNNVLAYLLEGVRRFALSKSCQTMIVTKPLLVMEKILNKMGFQRAVVDKEVIGWSLTYSTLYNVVIVTNKI